MEILLISHDGIASGAKKSAELILGPQENLHVIELTAVGGVGGFATELIQYLSSKTKESQNVIIISDLKNGSPYNTAVSYIINNDLADKVSLLTGMNLNMVLETIMLDGDSVTGIELNTVIGTAIDGISMMQPSDYNTAISTGDE
ncbi:PTS fructose transporter subunit IIA [Aeromonas sp. HMWF036]|uniref:PTS sugar transporter subunit IIA n=1 Tax=Aeromonas TaxID=642 RepID=UPI00093CFAC8|nr:MULTISPECIES: hypothetical protein [Aeromonas]MBO0397450.1 hypothetical protein [Aeromonas veronii]MBS4693204.1 hypothetical protein [Aeromonas veronii bv. veronii]OKP35599.1 hypothetical protein BJP23_16965 [Aeromonas veronii bv. veronii]PTS79856.1 PTS fructose transporter subunit IIA [Aeromonas sp. HMWF036]PTT28091.1 PTS fructose transporter subunit IIA [Aeromonas sp. HMWF017]